MLPLAQTLDQDVTPSSQHKMDARGKDESIMEVETNSASRTDLAEETNMDSDATSVLTEETNMDSDATSVVDDTESTPASVAKKPWKPTIRLGSANAADER